jgi:hypothetical protein
MLDSQVANMANCIKIAMDFVSDVEVARCFKLADERRLLEPETHVREDMLRIKEMLWYTYVYLRQSDSFEPIDKDAKRKEKEKARRVQHQKFQQTKKAMTVADAAAKDMGGTAEMTLGTS